jgi:hypothetical protein
MCQYLAARAPHPHCVPLQFQINSQSIIKVSHMSFLKGVTNRYISPTTARGIQQIVYITIMILRKSYKIADFAVDPLDIDI